MAFKEERRPVACAVICESPVEGELLQSMLERMFDSIAILSAEEARLQWPEGENLAMVLIALQDIAVAEEMARFHLTRWHRDGPRPKLVLLCSRDTVIQAYELCRELSISDYVVFWPVSLDPRRLLMAAHHACDAYMAELEAYAPGSTPAGASAPVEPQREILVIDDDELIQKSVTDVLRQEGYSVHAAADAHDALILLKDLRPSLILLDVDIPGINGLELLRKLKAGAVTANVPVFMLSGHNRREVVMEAYREGAVEFIAKPFKRELLLQKLEAALERPRSTEGVAGT